MIGLRVQVGGDWFNYARIFRTITSNDLSYALGRSDPGYGLLNWAVGELGQKVWAVNLVCAAIFTAGLISLCRQQPNPRLAIAVSIPYLVIVVAMGYTRQSAALGFLMLALSQYFRGSLVRMVVWLVLAAAFHKSAVIVIPMLAVASSQRRLTTFATLMLLAATTYYLFVAGSADDLVKNYIGARYASSGAAVRLAMNVVPAVLLLAFWRKFNFERQQLRLWVIFSIASLAAMAAYFVVPSSAAVDRVALYLIPLQVVVLSRLPSIFGTAERPSMVVLVAVLAYSLAVELVWLTMAANASKWIPYQNYLQKPSEMNRNIRLPLR